MEISLEKHQLTYKAVCGREAGNCDRTYQEENSCMRHTLYKTSEGFDIPGACGMDYRTCTKEKEAFEESVVKSVEAGSSKTQHGKGFKSLDFEYYIKTYPYENYPYVFNAAVSEQLFYIAFLESINHPQYG